MSVGDGADGQGERALVVGPLAMPGFLLVLIGVRRRRPLFVLAGAVMLGLAVKLVDRPPETADVWRAGAEEASVSDSSSEPERAPSNAEPDQPETT